MMTRYEKVFLVFAGIFIASLVIANSLVFKFFDVPLPIVGMVTLSLGILPYPVTFLVTDLISELYGKKRANYLVFVGFLVSIFFLIILTVGRLIPVSSAQDPIIQEHYLAVFGQGTRAILGSMTAYLAAQYLDVHLFHFFKRLTKGKHLWLRNNGSTLISQFVDTTLVVTILFYDDPNMSPLIPYLILSGYSFKICVALFDTPLIYLGVYFLEDLEAETIRRDKAYLDGERAGDQ